MKYWYYFREHCDHPQPFTTDDTGKLKDDSLATLLYAELVQYNPYMYLIAAKPNSKYNYTLVLGITLKIK